MGITWCNLKPEDIEIIKELLNNRNIRIVTHATHEDVQIVTFLLTNEVKFYKYDVISKTIYKIDPPRPTPLPEGFFR